jgi:hypothetical protein
MHDCETMILDKQETWKLCKVETKKNEVLVFWRCSDSEVAVETSLHDMARVSMPLPLPSASSPTLPHL